MVSICSTTYNHAQYIKQCLDGFLMQQVNFKYEILIHDDASTDGTDNIIREYAKKYPDIIKPLYEEENQYRTNNPKGMAYWNFSRAKGKYIAICEGDDYWIDPVKLQKQVDLLESRPELALCFHRAKIISTFTHINTLQCEHIADREYSATELFTVWTVPTASILFRADCLKRQLIDKHKFLNGDIATILTASLSGKLWGMSDVMSAYRMHWGGVSYNPEVQIERRMKYPDHYKAIKANFPNLDRNIVNESLARSYVNRAHIQKRITLKMLDYSRAVYYMPINELVKSLMRKVAKF